MTRPRCLSNFYALASTNATGGGGGGRGYKVYKIIGKKKKTTQQRPLPAARPKMSSLPVLQVHGENPGVREPAEDSAFGAEKVVLPEVPRGDGDLRPSRRVLRSERKGKGVRRR